MCYLRSIVEIMKYNIGKTNENVYKGIETIRI